MHVYITSHMTSRPKGKGECALQSNSSTQNAPLIYIYVCIYIFPHIYIYIHIYL